MLKRMLFPGILLSCCFVLSGCATTPSVQEKKEAAPAVEAPVAEATPAVEEKTTNPCDIILDEAVMESRKIMKTVSRSCEGNKIEATPVWSLDYKGAVHVRIFDAQSQKIRDETINP